VIAYLLGRRFRFLADRQLEDEHSAGTVEVSALSPS